MPFNCSAVARELVESQLFGHRRGAFTGAVDAFPGVVKAAERGTLFLDEIGDLEPLVQPKLLRFLESGEIQPVGEVRPQRVTVRIVAATNAQSGNAGRRRASSGATSSTASAWRSWSCRRCVSARTRFPPSRRSSSRGSRASAAAPDCKLADDFIAALLLYDWPGNIRQLANEIRRVAAMADRRPDAERRGSRAGSDRELERAADRAPARSSAPAVDVRLDQPLAMAIAELERKFIEHALNTSSGRVADAANCWASRARDCS